MLVGKWSVHVLLVRSFLRLSTRWIQLGALSPVMRFHDKGEGVGEPCADFLGGKNRCSKVDIWSHPREHFEAERDILQFRARLVAYLYSAAWQASREESSDSVGKEHPY